MTIRTRKIPSYRLHKPTGQAVVRLDGHDFYLGKYGTAASQEAYRRTIAEWLTRGPVASPEQPVHSELGPALTIGELILAYWHHAEGYYRRPDGSPSSELEKIRLSLRPLRQLYGGTPACEFGPKALKVVRQGMVDGGLCRRTVNQRVARIVRLFRFALENEILPAGVHHALKAVPGLRSGRSGAKESQSVKPVPDEYVDAVRPYLSRQLWAVVELQRLTGMRSGEALMMRTCDLEMSGEVWEYVPERHKTEHHGKRRRIFLGPRAQEVVRPWLRPNMMEFLFQPREAHQEYLAGRRRRRETPLTPSQRARTRKREPRRVPGDRYNPRVLAHAVARACERAGVPHWHPHQLRHNTATYLRKEFGLDVARVVLGHTSPTVTETYAEVDREKAARVMGQIG